MLSIGRIQFYETDAPAKAGIEGIVYMLMNIESEFARGVFTQTLHMVIVPEQQLLGKPNGNLNSDAGERSDDRSVTGTVTVGQPTSTGGQNSSTVDERFPNEARQSFANDDKSVSNFSNNNLL